MNRLTLATIVSTLFCGAAWSLAAIAGPFSYLQFTLALIATAVSFSLVVLCLCRGPKRRAATVRLVSVWLGISVAVGIAELAALAWPTDHLADNPWYMSTGEALVADPDLPWFRPPNLNWTGSSRGDLAIETNSPDPQARVVTFQTDFQGFRNSQDLAEAEIIFIGDSFTEAGNVPEEESFVSLTGEALNVVARNMGVAGFAPPSELVVLQKYGLACSPRVVVWQIAETNDLDDAVFFMQWQQAGRPSVLPGFSKAKPTRVEGWKRRSPSRLLFHLVRSEEPWPFRGDFVDQRGDKYTLRFEMSFPPDVRQHPGWQVIEFSITSGAELLKEKNIQLVVMLIPRKLRVMAPATDFHEFDIPTGGQGVTIKHTLPVGWDLDPEARLNAHLKQLCEHLAVPFVDTTAPLTERASDGELVYQAMDTHLSPAGHKVVADLLSRAIEKPHAE